MCATNANTSNLFVWGKSDELGQIPCSCVEDLIL